MESLIKSTNKKNSLVNISLVISNNPSAKGLIIANKKKVPAIYTVPKKNFEKKVSKYLKDIDMICLAGFMQVLAADFVLRWSSRLINIHPSYLPKFKGLNAQDQAIKAKLAYSGCTVHYVSPKIDSGKIILQKKIKILKKDNTESLSKKILIGWLTLKIKPMSLLKRSVLTKWIRGVGLSFLKRQAKKQGKPQEVTG